MGRSQDEKGLEIMPPEGMKMLELLKKETSLGPTKGSLHVFERLPCGCRGIVKSEWKLHRNCYFSTEGSVSNKVTQILKFPSLSCWS